MRWQSRFVQSVYTLGPPESAIWTFRFQRDISGNFLLWRTYGIQKRVEGGGTYKPIEDVNQTTG